MSTANEFRFPSFWRLQAVGWSGFFLLSAFVVFPYLWQPSELGYQTSRALFFDQGLMCFLCFLASLALRPVCRTLLQRSLPWVTLEAWTVAWSLMVGTSTALTADLFVIQKPEQIELVEACAKASVLLFLWCNLYFGIKQSQRRVEGTQEFSGREKTFELKQAYASHFNVRTGTRIQVVSVEEVEWVAAAADYAELHTRNGVHLLRETMKTLEKKLDPSKFVRIHRSRIVSLGCILELRSIENREYVVRLSDGSQHRSSRTYADRIEGWLGKGEGRG